MVSGTSIWFGALEVRHAWGDSFMAEQLMPMMLPFAVDVPPYAGVVMVFINLQDTLTWNLNTFCPNHQHLLHLPNGFSNGQWV